VKQASRCKQHCTSTVACSSFPSSAVTAKPTRWRNDFVQGYHGDNDVNGGSTILDVVHEEGLADYLSKFDEKGSSRGDSDFDCNFQGDKDIQRASVESIDVDDKLSFLTTIAPIHILKPYGYKRLIHSALCQGWSRITLMFVVTFFVMKVVLGLLYWFQINGIVENSDVTVSNYELASFKSLRSFGLLVGWFICEPSRAIS
jgi:hypothetical protein